MAPKEHWTRVGKEPDYRFTLANERTFLAWVRTALAILAAGVVLNQYAGSVPERHGLVWLAAGLILIASTISAAAFFRWRKNQLAMRLSEPLAHGPLVAVLAICMGVIAIAALFLLST
ncbi:MAG: DUF202 domain-containing protein [Burkholderiaceae bacterium]